MEDRMNDLAVIATKHYDLNDTPSFNSDYIKSRKSKSKYSKKKKKCTKKAKISDDPFKDEYKSLCDMLELIREKLTELENQSACKIESIAKNKNFSDEKIMLLKSHITGAINKFHSKLIELNELVSNDEFGEENDSRKRMKKMLLSSLSMEFKELVKEFEENQKQACEQYNRIVKHQLKVINPDIKIPENKQPSDLILSELITDSLTEDGLKLLNERHLQLRSIEQELIEIQQMYIDIAELVQIQGERIESIDNYVDKTKIALDMAHKDLVKAYKHKKRIRKKKILLVSLVASAFISIGAIFSGVFIR